MEKWRKHPTRDGILVRVLRPEDVADERQKEKEAEEQERLKASRRWLRPIPHLDWPEIERLAEKTFCGLGGKICDAWGHKHGRIVTAAGRYYATLSIRLYVQYEVPGGGLDTSDAIDVVIYRNPEQPRKLRLTYGKLLSATREVEGERHAH